MRPSLFRNARCVIFFAMLIASAASAAVILVYGGWLAGEIQHSGSVSLGFLAAEVVGTITGTLLGFFLLNRMLIVPLFRWSEIIRGLAKGKEMDIETIRSIEVRDFLFFGE